MTSSSVGGVGDISGDFSVTINWSGPKTCIKTTTAVRYGSSAVNSPTSSVEPFTRTIFDCSCGLHNKYKTFLNFVYK